MIRSPALSEDSMSGQNRSNASKRVAVRQLPKRTHSTLVVASGLLARYKKSSSLLMIMRPSWSAYLQISRSEALARPISNTCWQSCPWFRKYLARDAGSWLSTKNFTFAAQRDRFDRLRNQLRRECLHGLETRNPPEFPQK